MANSNEYMRKYMKKKYVERRELAFSILGKMCVICGATENLEIDHIDPKTKTIALNKLWSCALSRFLSELKLCQTLCKSCHKIKSDKEISVEHGQGLTGKRNCYCDLCKPLKRAYI
jgi:5-methylcytosine-specific restriction endonuclease McrA